MNLPKTKFVTNSPWRQFFHLCSEVWEVFKELAKADYRQRFATKQHAGVNWFMQAGDELIDIQISAHTLRHILQDRYGVSMKNCEEYVLQKGIDRGYYL